jgi:hypothetical protein
MTAKVELKQTLKVGDEIEFCGEKRKVTQLLGITVMLEGVDEHQCCVPVTRTVRAIEVVVREADIADHDDYGCWDMQSPLLGDDANEREFF